MQRGCTLLMRLIAAIGGDGIPLLHELVAPNVDMQTATVPETTERIVSVVQTDEQVDVPEDASASHRRQVLDGVVAYGELAIVIENKPWHGNIWPEQLSVSVPEGAEHDPKVACVTWKDVVASWSRLLDSGHLSLSESLLVGDFLDYVEQHFPGLRPYSRVALCGTDTQRLLRRCKAALVRLAGPDAVRYHRAWGWFIDLDDGQCARKIGFFPAVEANQICLVLEVDPGDTMGQARILYDRVPLEDVLGLLQEPNWVGWSNFHLMFMTSGFFRPGRLTKVSDYWKRWSEGREFIRQWKREEYSDAFEALRRLGVVDDQHREEFDRQTVESKRGNICFAPGVTIQWQLPLGEAAKLDDRDLLEDRLRAAIERVTKVLRLRWPAGAGAP